MADKPTKKRTPRVTDPARPPAGAVTFDCWRLFKQEGTGKEGKRYVAWKPKRLYGDPGPDSRVTERWPIEELSPAAILKRWGAGRYRVRYLGPDNELVGAVDWALAEPSASSGSPLDAPDGAPAAAGSPADRIRSMAGQLGGASVVELMLLLNDARDSAARQAREEADRRADRERLEADRRAQRDQHFFDRFLQQQPAAASVAAAAPAVDMTRELALMRREMSLTIREETQRIRAEILNELPEDKDGAENFGQALESAGVGIVEGVGEQVPEVIGGLLGKLKAWLQLNGQPATAADMQKLIEAAHAAVAAQAAAEVNGAGN
jgi:hypothetical protein